MPTPPIITLLTDFGLSDHYVAAMKGVILGICPEARLVDITHEIRPFEIEEAAFTLAQACPCFPDGAIHLIVVDPGVGSARRPLLLEAGGHRFVAPDNGVLSFALRRDPGHEAREITEERYFRRPVSRTFHGRDIFAPVAAHLARGVAPGLFGHRISDPVRLDFPEPVTIGNGLWSGRVLRIDRFGNIVTSFDCNGFRALESRPFEMRVGAARIFRYVDSYADAPSGNPVIVRGSSGYYEVSVNRGNAAEVLEITRPMEVNLSLGEIVPNSTGTRLGTRG
jgi:S-adenosylmethionine hydrolase